MNSSSLESDVRLLFESLVTEHTKEVDFIALLPRQFSEDSSFVRTLHDGLRRARSFRYRPIPWRFMFTNADFEVAVMMASDLLSDRVAQERVPRSALVALGCGVVLADAASRIP